MPFDDTSTTTATGASKGRSTEPISATPTYPIVTNGFIDSPGFHPYHKPPRITGPLTDNDEAIVTALENGWPSKREPQCPANDDDYYVSPSVDAFVTDVPRRGLKMDELVEAVRVTYPDMDRPTLVALMHEAGHLSHDPKERRYLLSDDSISAGIGRNVRPKGRQPFSIVYPEHAPMITQTIPWEWVLERMASLPDQATRRRFAVEHLSHLPVATLVRQTGVSQRTLERDLNRHRAMNERE